MVFFPDEPVIHVILSSKTGEWWVIIRESSPRVISRVDNVSIMPGVNSGGH